MNGALPVVIAYGLILAVSRAVTFRLLARGRISRRAAALATAAISSLGLVGFIALAGAFDALGIFWLVIAVIHFVLIYGWVELLTSPATG